MTTPNWKQALRDIIRKTKSPNPNQPIVCAPFSLIPDDLPQPSRFDGTITGNDIKRVMNDLR